MTKVELRRTLHVVVRNLHFILSLVGNYRFNCCFKKIPKYRALNKKDVSDVTT